MLVNLYKTKSPVAIFSLPLLIASLALPIFFRNSPEVINVYTWQSIATTNVLTVPWLNYVLTVLLVFIGAVQLSNTVNNHDFYSKNTYLPSFIFVTFLVSLNELNFSFNLVGYVLIIYGLGYLFRITRQDSAKHFVFMASLLFGIAIVMSPILFLVALLPIFTLTIFRTFVWREFFLVLLGLAIPWGYLYALFYFFSGSILIKTEGLSLVNDDIKFTLGSLTLTGTVIFLILFSGWNYMVLASSQLLSFKKRSRILYHFVWIAFSIALLEWYFYDVMLSVFIIPFSIFISLHLLNAKQPKFINTFILLWFCLAVIQYLVQI